MRRPWVVSMLALMLATAAVAAAQETMIHAGSLVDPLTGSNRTEVTIVIEDGKIERVVDGFLDGPEANLIDLAELVVMPGLFDCHSHLCEMIEVDGNLLHGFAAAALSQNTADRAVQGVINARSYVEAGFTTVRDVGNALAYADVAVKRAIERGDIVGPTALVAGKIIAPFAGQYMLTHESMNIAELDYIFADSRDEMRRGIRENIHYGADWIKIVVDDQRYIYTADDVRFIVEEAGRAGVKVAAHCMTDAGARNAVAGGVASIEHGFFLDDETLQMMKDGGVWLVGTDFSTDILAVYGLPEWEEKVVDRLRRAHRIGVRMAYGSDVVVEVPGHDRGSAALTVLDAWIAAEVPNEDILRAMTVDAAELLELGDERGQIRQGMAADIIATQGNPLDDITALRNVVFVMKDGSVVKQSH